MKNCKFCNKEILQKYKYCSKECKLKNRKINIKKINKCFNCNTFTNNQKFCSISCFKKNQWETSEVI